MNDPKEKPKQNKPQRLSQAGLNPEKMGFVDSLMKKYLHMEPIKRPSIPDPASDQTPSKPDKVSLMVPIMEEIKDELKWLLRVLHVHDFDADDKYLSAYRKLRGWE